MAASEFNLDKTLGRKPEHFMNVLCASISSTWSGLYVMFFF